MKKPTGPHIARANLKKKRGPYKTKPAPDFPGRGAIKCGICGDPIVEHDTNDFCGGMSFPKGKR